MLLTRPVIAHEAQLAFDAAKPRLAIEIADAARNKAALLREDPPR